MKLLICYFFLPYIALLYLVHFAEPICESPGPDYTEYNGKYYKLSFDKATKDEAKGDCASDGTQLINFQTWSDYTVLNRIIGELYHFSSVILIFTLIFLS